MADENNAVRGRGIHAAENRIVVRIPAGAGDYFTSTSLMSLISKTVPGSASPKKRPGVR